MFIAEDWVPITTPDGWVLLPSLPPTTDATNTTTIKDGLLTTLSTTSTTTTTLAPNVNVTVSLTNLTSATTTSPIDLESLSTVANVNVSTVQPIFEATSTDINEQGINMSDYTEGLEFLFFFWFDYS